MRWIIDTDCGVDDAIAIGMPFAPNQSYPFEIEAFTTVAGNVALNKVNVNVGAVSDLFGITAPIFSGCDRPLIAKHETAEGFHGQDGLGGNNLNVTQRRPEAEHAAQAIVRLAKQYEGEISILALAPLTNIALAYNLDNELPRRLKKLVIMGGAWQAFGNQSSAAEFNIAVDPESAHVVFEHFENIVLVPWEPSLVHEWPFERIAALGQRNTPRGTFCWKMCEKLIPTLRDIYGHSAFPSPDPMAMAVALDESIITQEIAAFVQVDTAHHFGRGLTTLNRRHLRPNSRVVTAVDEQRFFAMMESAWG